MEQSTTLKMQGIRKTFPGVTALDDVEFDLKEGEVHALVGENGAGKSTLIRILAGVYNKDAGEIIYNGRKVEIHSSIDAQRLGFGFIHQELNLVPYFDTYENVVLGLKYPRNSLGFIHWQNLRKKINEIAQRLDIDFDLRKPVSELSSSQRRMVMIARALVRQAKIIVMDESTSALSEHEIKILFKLIKNLKKQKVSVIYISHRLEEIFTIADRVSVMRDGRKISTNSINDVDLNELITLMLNKTLKEEFPKARVEIGENLLSVRQLSRDPEIKGISFNLHAGEILGITGLLGSGKTELARALFGIDPTVSGEIFIEGKQTTIRCPQDAIRLGMVLIPEERREQGLVISMTLKENMTLPNLKNYLLVKWFGLLSVRKEIETAQKYIDSLSITTSGHNQTVDFLSGGNQQKVVLAKWLAGNSKIIIFDEPTRGIDVGSKTDIYRLIGDIAKRSAGIILISSEIEEIMGICDRVLVLREGEIIKKLKIEETTYQEVVRFCYGGT